MSRTKLFAAGAATAGNLLAWVAHTEQIWFPMMGAYVRFLAPETGLPDLRGPFLLMTMMYIGLRIGDLWNDKENVIE